MNFKIMKKLIVITMTITIAVFFTGCGANDAKTQATSKIVNIGITNSPMNLNPIDPGDMASTQMVNILYQPLLELDDNMTFVPMLADSVNTTDNKTFTVKLNDKAKWTDGKPVTADDVVFTVKLISNKKTNSMIASNFSILQGLDDKGLIPDAAADIEGIKKLDDHTVQFKTKAQVSSNIFNNAISRNINTVPEHIFKSIDPAGVGKSAEVQKPTVTDGAFKLVSYVKDQSVQFEANKDFFKGAPKLDKLNFKILQGTNITAQLQSGEIDMNMPVIGTIPADDYDKVKRMTGVATVSGKPSALQFMFINNKNLSDVRLRQAISCAIDRNTIVEKLLKGQAEAEDSFFTSTNLYKNKSLPMTTLDVEKAKKLVKESGWDTAKPIRFYVPTGNKSREQAADLITENLKAIGLNIQMQKFDFATDMAKTKSGDYDLTIMGDTLIPIDPTYDLPFFVTKGNYCNYENPEVDKIVDGVKVEVNNDKVKESLNKMQEILIKDVPMPILYATRELYATNKRVMNGKPKDYGTFINVYQWDVK